MKKCPVCNLENSDYTRQCDCGFDFNDDYSEHDKISDGSCALCEEVKRVYYCRFKSNATNLSGEKDPDYSGSLCFPCMATIFYRYTWGSPGISRGPLVLMNNLEEFFSYCFKYLFKKKEKIKKPDEPTRRKKLY